jgi:hypothetical protein
VVTPTVVVTLCGPQPYKTRVYSRKLLLAGLPGQLPSLTPHLWSGLLVHNLRKPEIFRESCCLPNPPGSFPPLKPQMWSRLLTRTLKKPDIFQEIFRLPDCPGGYDPSETTVVVAALRRAT